MSLLTASEYFNAFMLHVVLILTTSNLCSRLCGKIQHSLNDSYGLLQKRKGMCTLLHENSFEGNNDQFSYLFCPNIGTKCHVFPYRELLCIISVFIFYTYLLYIGVDTF